MKYNSSLIAISLLLGFSQGIYMHNKDADDMWDNMMDATDSSDYVKDAP